MKKTNQVFISLLILSFLLSACGKSPSPTSSSNPTTDTLTPTEQTETSAEQSNAEPEATIASGIKVDMPAGWEKVGGSVNDIHFMKGTASFIAKTEPFPEKDLDLIIIKAQEMFKGTFDDFSIQGEVEKTTIAGQDARKMTFTAALSSLKMKYTYVYTINDNKVYSITFGDLASTFDNNIVDYDKILNGISF